MTKRRARGEGSLRKRSDGRWEGRYTVGRDENGKLLYRNVLARTQAECKTKLREAIRNMKQGSTPAAPKTPSKRTAEAAQPKITVGEWLQTWYDLYSKPNIRMTTQEYYSNFITNHLVPRIGDVPLDKLTGLRLQKLYQDLRTDGKVHQNKNSPGLSPKTIRGMHVMLHKALEQAVKEELIKKNPTNDCTPPKVEKKEMKVIKPEQVGAYLQAAANHHVLPMFYLELTSGLRRGELLALLWTDLDPDRRTISVSKSVLGRKGELKVSAPKTRHSIRTVMIPQQTVDLLIQEHDLHPDNPYMFPSPVTGTMYHPDTAGRIHCKLLKEAGIEHIRFHDLRHPNVKPKTKTFSTFLNF